MILDSFRLVGKVALVTGASQGLGQAMAIALAEAGADVAGLDRNSSQETGEVVRSLGRRYREEICDLRSISVGGLSKLTAQIVVEMGRLDIWLNNAGIIRRTPALWNSVKLNWDDVLTVNLEGQAFFLWPGRGEDHGRAGRRQDHQHASMLSFQGGILVPSYTGREKRPGRDHPRVGQ